MAGLDLEEGELRFLDDILHVAVKHFNEDGKRATWPLTWAGMREAERRALKIRNKVTEALHRLSPDDA